MVAPDSKKILFKTNLSKDIVGITKEGIQTFSIDGNVDVIIRESENDNYELNPTDGSSHWCPDSTRFSYFLKRYDQNGFLASKELYISLADGTDEFLVVGGAMIILKHGIIQLGHRMEADWHLRGTIEQVGGLKYLLSKRMVPND